MRVPRPGMPVPKPGKPKPKKPRGENYNGLNDWADKRGKRKTQPGKKIGRPVPPKKTR